MSFETNFDYTKHIAMCDERINAYTTINNNADAKIIELNNLSGYADYVVKQLAQQQSTKINAQDFILKLNQLKTEIGVVEALSAENKQILYDFYIMSGDRRENYGLRILFNHATLIVDAVPVLGDVVISPDMKMSIGMDICHKYPINTLAELLHGAKFSDAV